MAKEKTICLNMIVRNEAKVIARCLASVLPVIDYWVICDTGSADETPAVIAEALASVPGELHHHEWVNFGANRTRAIKIAEQKADYVLLIDADMILNVHRAFKSSLNASSYLIRYTGSLDYWQTMLVNSAYRWEYVGPTHEYIHSPLGHHAEKLDAVSLTHFADGGERSAKFTRDISLLEAALADDPNNTRYLFYLAQSYANLGNFEQAIRVYRKRIDAGGWDEERWYSMYQLAVMLERSGAEAGIVSDAFLRAYEYRPSRAEPLYHLAKMMRVSKRYTLGLLYIEKALKIPYPQDILFIEKPVYDYLVLFEYAICAHYAGQTEDAIRANDLIIGNPETSAQIARQAIVNKRFSLKKFISERAGPGAKRIAGVSFDLHLLSGSGISLKSLLNYFSQKGWPVWQAAAFPADDALRDWKPDVLISQHWATAPAAKTAKEFGIPLIMYVHGPNQYGFPGLGEIKPDFVICSTSHEYFLIKKKYPHTEGIVLHPVISPVSGAVPGQAEYITLIGNTAAKGNDIFFAIASRMPEQKFLLVGDRVEGQLLPENIRHIPATSDMSAVYEMTKLLLVPSVHESYGRVVVEAAGFGIVSVVTDCPGTREATGFQHAVYITDRTDPDKWIAAIHKVLDNPEAFSAFPVSICNELDTGPELGYAALKISMWADR
ncbi:MAG TPA: glycosyltransferase [Mucilaginibacter sp.]|nr:glycosyltransferase [Mucilaginibacter sp.]